MIGGRPVERKTALWILVAAGVLAALVGILVYQNPGRSVAQVVWPLMAGFLAPVLFIILPVALPVGIAVWVLRGMGVIGPRAPEGGKSARDILDERLARGEIDKDEHEERKLAISS
jgi:putative membrane protein